MTTEADRFAAEYVALRAHEPWADRDRARRAAAIVRAVRLIRSELGPGALIVDAGAGAMAVEGTIAVDIVPPARAGGLAVRADMRHLPFRDGAVDAVLYAASLHYAPVEIAVAEAARVVRPGGMFMAVDSPIYDGPEAAAAASARSAAYYARTGHPSLAAHYHPIELSSLRRALAGAGFDVTRLVTGSGWRRLLGRGPDSFVAARRS